MAVASNTMRYCSFFKKWPHSKKMVLLLYFSGCTLLLCLCEWALQPTKLCSTLKYIFEVNKLKLISMNILLWEYHHYKAVWKNPHHVLHWKCNYPTVAPYFTSGRSGSQICWLVKPKLNLRTWKSHLASVLPWFHLHSEGAQAFGALCGCKAFCTDTDSELLQVSQRMQKPGTRHVLMLWPSISYLNENTEW